MMILLATSLSLVLIGLPAAFLKTLAGFFFASGQNGVVRASLGWGALVGVVTLFLHLAILPGLLNVLIGRHFMQSIAGWIWTAIGLAVLAFIAIALDYWKVVRPLRSKMTCGGIIGFLALSNAWVLGGAILLGLFYSTFLFAPCVDPATDQLADSFSAPRPENCQELSD
jgi:hypothetical protein